MIELIGGKTYSEAILLESGAESYYRLNESSGIALDLISNIDLMYQYNAINALSNVGWEVDATGAGANGAVVLARVSSEYHTGGYCIQVDTDAIAEGISQAAHPTELYSVGDVINLGAWVKAPIGFTFVLRGREGDTGTNALITESSISGVFVGTGEWEWYEYDRACINDCRLTLKVTANEATTTTFYVDEMFMAPRLELDALREVSAPIIDGDYGTSFNGTAYFKTYLPNGSASETGEWCMEAWCKRPVTGSYTRVIADQRIAGGGTFCGLTLDSATDRMRLVVRDETSTTAVKYEDIQASDDEWHHYVGGVDGDGYLRLYKDGVEQNTTPVVEPGGSYNSQIRGIGAGADATNPWFGRIDDVSVYNRMLTDTEVKRHYGLGLGERSLRLNGSNWVNTQTVKL